MLSSNMKTAVKLIVTGILMVACLVSISLPSLNITNVAQSIPVMADDEEADTSGPEDSIADGNSALEGTFRNCNFRDAQGDSDAFQNCLGTIFQFIVVISFLLILFRIALAALNSYNPFGDGGSPVNNAVTIVWDIVLGLIFIGGPILIIGSLNPALLNFQIIDITPLTGSNSGGSSSGDSSSDGDSSGESDQGSSDDGGGSSINGVTNDEIIESYDLLRDGTKENEDGEVVPATSEETQAAADVFNDLKVDIYICHRILRPLTANCTEWDSLTKETKVAALNGRRFVEANPDLNRDLDPEFRNTSVTNENGPYLLTSGSLTVSAVLREGVPDTTLLPDQQGCDRYLMEFDTPTGFETFGEGNDFVDLPGFSENWFHTPICDGDISNPYFSINPLNGEVEFKGSQSFNQDSIISNLKRDQAINR